MHKNGDALVKHVNADNFANNENSVTSKLFTKTSIYL